MDKLIDRWISGHEGAAEELYDRYLYRVKEFLFTLGARGGDAEEIAHEAMVAAMETVKKGKRPDRFTYWVLGISRNMYFRRSRRSLGHITDTVDPAARGARTLAVRREMKDLLDRKLGELPRKDQQILDLLHRKGFSRREVADKLGMTMDAVHARCERVHDRLRGELARHVTTVALQGGVPPPISLDDVRALRPAFRSVFTARHLEGLKETEASAKLSIPAATLRARLKSAYEMLGCGEDSDFSRAREEFEAVREESS
ncbi:MAG TPA: sigma-70 family RNA polymerase sigma factor [Planctomycetota bacterium]|nr:sigma-70 family RNA polymerase sigma factor [Planctomycetota bacterium]